MPRIATAESSGCRPIRALTFDSLGLIKVIESGAKDREAVTVVNTWGDMNPSRCVLAASMNDRPKNPLLAVARKDGVVEVLDPTNGDLHFTYSVFGDDGCSSEDNEISGLHLFRKHKEADRSCTLLTCTKKGDVSLRSVKYPSTQSASSDNELPKTWKASGSGELLVGKVDGSENYGLFGGKRVEMNLWDLEQCSKIWNAKSPPKDNLGIFTPTWFTCATFLNNDDHRKFVTGTKSHQVRLYDVSAQRRPVLSFDFRESAITAMAEDQDGYTIYVGNTSADLASFDIRTGKLVGCFLGKCSGSIRSVVRHPQHQVIASCGLDRYMRVYDVKTRQLISAVFLKQHLTSLVFDSSFTGEVAVVNTVATPAIEEEPMKIPAQEDDDESGDETEKAPVKTKKLRKEKRSREKVPEAEENKEEQKSKKQKKKTKKVKHDHED